MHEACFENFARIVLNAGRVCPETVAFVRCDALAQKLDLSKLPHSDVLQLQKDIENTLSNYKFNCKIDLQGPATGPPMPGLEIQTQPPREVTPNLIPGNYTMSFLFLYVST